jgi:predicted amidophosphoribosyltransferase
MYAIKNDSFIEDPPVLASDWIAKTLQGNMGSIPFSAFFQPTTILVPVPKSGLTNPGSLWVPERIAAALVKRGVGKQVIACLARITPIRKAAWSGASNRPTPSEQYQTMGVQGSISELKPKEIVLVDDIVTRGATSLGAANRLVEAFPEARIRVFAAMRTISNSSEFEALYKPVSGTITYREDRDDSIRRP